VNGSGLCAAVVAGFYFLALNNEIAAQNKEFFRTTSLTSPAQTASQSSWADTGSV
jgi:hypothetical protein